MNFANSPHIQQNKMKKCGCFQQQTSPSTLTILTFISAQQGSKSHESSVGIVLGYGLHDQGSRV
jgi:hypothetical protein